jgi:UDP-2-acetamido-2-deoxy-ribo-hexuluronate aminotransferase
VKDGRRDELKKFLESKKIPSMVYYPGPLHVQKAYRYLGYSENDFPVTTALCKEVLSLPMHPDMDREQIDYITHNVWSFSIKHNNGEGIFCSRNSCY